MARNEAGFYNAGVLTTEEILGELERRGIKRIRIAEALNLPDPRISEMYRGARRMSHDEAVKLVRAFNLEDRREALPAPVAKMLVLHAMNKLGHRVDPDSDHVRELSQDFRAFAEFAADPNMEVTEPLLEAFLKGRLSSALLSAQAG